MICPNACGRCQGVISHIDTSAQALRRSIDRFDLDHKSVGGLPEFSSPYLSAVYELEPQALAVESSFIPIKNNTLVLSCSYKNASYLV